MKRIVFVMDRFRTGGAESVFLNLARHTDRRILLIPVHRELDRHLIQLLPENVKVIFPDPPVNRNSCGLLRLLLFSRRLRRRLPEGTAVVNFSDTLTTLLVSRALNPAKYYSWIHCNPRELLRSRTWRAYFRLLRGAQELIFVCRSQRDLFFSLPQSRRIRRGKARVCPNYADVEQIRRQTDDSRTGAERRPYFLTAARLDLRSKDFGTLFEGYARLPEDIRGTYPLVILGDGPDREKIRQMAGDAGIRTRVIFAGLQAPPWKAMREASVYIQCSRAEGFSLALLEALACGGNTVAADCPTGPAEILAGGRYGRLFPAGDPETLAEKILEALQEPIPPEAGIERARRIDDIGIRKIREFLRDVG